MGYRCIKSGYSLYQIFFKNFDLMQWRVGERVAGTSAPGTHRASISEVDTHSKDLFSKTTTGRIKIKELVGASIQ